MSDIITGMLSVSCFFYDMKCFASYCIFCHSLAFIFISERKDKYCLWKARQQREERATRQRLLWLSCPDKAFCETLAWAHPTSLQGWEQSPQARVTLAEIMLPWLNQSDTNFEACNQASPEGNADSRCLSPLLVERVPDTSVPVVRWRFGKVAFVGILWYLESNNNDFRKKI